MVALASCFALCPLVFHDQASFEFSPSTFQLQLYETTEVTFVAVHFDYIEETIANGINVRVCCPVGNSDKGKVALDVAVKPLDIFTKYFLMPYPFSKLDMVLVSEFSDGVMENYGLIIYRGTILLHNDLLSAAAIKHDLTIIVAHEVNHQWFGNLTTTEWWTHM
ncbi:hypothetical protein REPUB_Repub06bG0031500 [Reevesia pubescens]